MGSIVIRDAVDVAPRTYGSGEPSGSEPPGSARRDTRVSPPGFEPGKLIQPDAAHFE